MVFFCDEEWSFFFRGLRRFFFPFVNDGSFLGGIRSFCDEHCSPFFFSFLSSDIFPPPLLSRDPLSRDFVDRRMRREGVRAFFQQFARF